MNRGFRQIFVRALCFLAVLGPLAAATPGCGDSARKDEAGGGIPANVQDSNRNMENFQKSQQKAKK